MTDEEYALYVTAMNYDEEYVCYVTAMTDDELLSRFEENVAHYESHGIISYRRVGKGSDTPLEAAATETDYVVFNITKDGLVVVRLPSQAFRIIGAHESGPVMVSVLPPTKDMT